MTILASRFDQQRQSGKAQRIPPNSATTCQHTNGASKSGATPRDMTTARVADPPGISAERCFAARGANWRNARRFSALRSLS
jgi:hypothetical protein